MSSSSLFQTPARLDMFGPTKHDYAPAVKAMDANAQTYKSCTEESRKRELLERSVFVVSVVGIAMFASWILWVPMLHLFIPEMKKKGQTNIVTISETFSTHNVLVTIYLILPISVFFLFRSFRVFRNNATSDSVKKGVFLVVLLHQIFILIVMRYDKVKGLYHVIFTSLAIFCLYFYHFLTWERNSDSKWLSMVKPVFGLLSLISVVLFAALQLGADVEEESVYEWSVIAEVFGLCLLGAMDLIDIKNLGEEIDKRQLESAPAGVFSAFYYY